MLVLGCVNVSDSGSRLILQHEDKSGATGQQSSVFGEGKPKSSCVYETVCARSHRTSYIFALHKIELMVQLVQLVQVVQVVCVRAS